ADDPPDNDGDDLGGDSGYRAYAALLAARHARLAAEVAARAAVPKLYQGWLFDVLMSLRELAEATTAGGSEVEKWAQARLLREIAGTPFRLVRVRPQWLWWEDGLARRLAEAMYEERSFDRMPILADVLEDAGCSDADLLTHCRSGGEHVRGCWVA